MFFPEREFSVQTTLSPSFTPLIRWVQPLATGLKHVLLLIDVRGGELPLDGLAEAAQKDQADLAHVDEPQLQLKAKVKLFSPFLIAACEPADCVNR
ncbi:hypothetical protein ACJJWD_12330 [Comamonas testosteroni]|uniref:hypothetical protein n=1 Tax=Comamonas testosteroni TaxID=285 RepID=UPI00389A22E3